MKVKETHLFSKQISVLVSESSYQHLLGILALNPEYGLPMPGGEGLRRTRWDERGDAEEGGVKIIYFWDAMRQEVYMLMAFDKDEQDNFSNDQRKELRQRLRGVLGDAHEAV
jgi:hypothetical protein